MRLAVVRVTDIYLVIIEDRHIDVEVLPFTSLEAAIETAKTEVRALARHEEDIEWGEPMSEAAIADGWCWRVAYSCEGDSVRVIRRELN